MRAITERLRHRFDFVILTSRLRRTLAAREEEAGASIVRVGAGRPADKLLFPLAAPLRALRLGSFDLVHAVMASGGALAAAGYLRLRRRPSLLTLQDGDSEEYVRGWLGPLFPLYPRLHRSFDHVHAVSGSLARRAVRYGARPEQVSVVPNGCDLALFRPRPPDEEESRLRRALGLEGARVIVSVSRLVPTTGTDRLLRAWPRVLARVPGAVLLVVGDGERRGALEALARELGVAARVRFAGGVDPGDVPRYLRLAEVFARPSLQEGLGSAFLEAMACGLPVVGSQAGGIPDFLTDGVTGLACDPDAPASIADAIVRLLECDALARELAAAGRARVVRDYDWDRVAERIGGLYDRLAAGKVSPAPGHTR